MNHPPPSAAKIRSMFSRDLQEHGCKVRYRSVWVRKLNL